MGRIAVLSREPMELTELKKETKRLLNIQDSAEKRVQNASLEFKTLEKINGGIESEIELKEKELEKVQADIDLKKTELKGVEDKNISIQNDVKGCETTIKEAEEKAEGIIEKAHTEVSALRELQGEIKADVYAERDIVLETIEEYITEISELKAKIDSLSVEKNELKQKIEIDSQDLLVLTDLTTDTNKDLHGMREEVEKLEAKREKATDWFIQNEKENKKHLDLLASIKEEEKEIEKKHNELAKREDKIKKDLEFSRSIKKAIDMKAEQIKRISYNKEVKQLFKELNIE